MIVLWYVLDVCPVINYVGVKTWIKQVSHLKLQIEMILLKVNLLLGRIYYFKSIISPRKLRHDACEDFIEALHVTIDDASKIAY